MSSNATKFTGKIMSSTDKRTLVKMISVVQPIDCPQKAEEPRSCQLSKMAWM